MKAKDFLPVENKTINNYNKSNLLTNSIKEKFFEEKHSRYYTINKYIKNINGQKKKMNIFIRKSELKKIFDKDDKKNSPLFKNKNNKNNIILHQSLISLKTASQKSLQSEVFSNLNINLSENFLKWKKKMNELNKIKEKKIENIITINNEKNKDFNFDNFFKKKNDDNQNNIKNYLIQEDYLNKKKDNINKEEEEEEFNISKKLKKMKKTNKSNRRKKKKKIILKTKDNNDNSIKYNVLTDLSNYKVNNIIAVKNFSNKLYVFANCIDLEKDEENEYLIEQEIFKSQYPYMLIDFYESKLVFG